MLPLINDMSDQDAAPSNTDDEDGDLSLRKRKRRSALACNRCKSRKQKCNMEGRSQPGKCKACDRKGLDCVFPTKSTKAGNPVEYVMSLESRVAELEAAIGRYNPSDPLISDHLYPRAVSSPSVVSPADGGGDNIICNTEEVTLDVPSSLPVAYPLQSSRAQQPFTSSTHSSPNSKPGGPQKVSDEIAAGVALLSLNSSAEAHYLGGSSGFSWAKVILGMLDQPQIDRSPVNGLGNLLAKPVLSTSRLTLTSGSGPVIPSPDATSMMLEAFFLHVHARYPFMDYPLVRGWLAKSNDILSRSSDSAATIEDRTAAFFIWMIFAVGSRLLPQSKVTGLSSPETYYGAAISHLEIVTRLHNIANIQAFLIMVMYSLRCTEGPSAWHLIGLSLRMCIDLGLHRRNPAAQRSDPYQEEMRRRVFWTTFGLDRMMAVALGRPLGIDERDIDQPLPRDIDVSMRNVPVDEDSDVVDLDPANFHYGPVSPTSMSSAIHVIRLRLIESHIQRSVYRVQRASTSERDLRREVDKLMRESDRWLQGCPQTPSGPQAGSTPCCSIDWWSHKYEECRLLLLRPLTAQARIGDPYLAQVAKSAANLSQVQLRLHQNPAVAHSLTSLHSIFLTGLTLLHAIQLDPMIIPLGESSRAVRACSNTLFMYAQHFAAAEPFRDSFEDLATASAERSHQPSTFHKKSVETSSTRSGLATSDWVGEMTSWMNNADSQNNFLTLLASMGYTPDVRVNRTQSSSIALQAPTVQALPTDSTMISGLAQFDDMDLSYLADNPAWLNNATWNDNLWPDGTFQS